MSYDKIKIKIQDPVRLRPFAAIRDGDCECVSFLNPQRTKMKIMCSPGCDDTTRENVVITLEAITKLSVLEYGRK